jgi:type IV pilus assembly protein PilO
MANFKQLPYLAQIGIVAVVILLLAGGAYWYSLAPLAKANQDDALTLRTKQAEVAQLAPYKKKLVELNQQTADLKSKMQDQAKIVPEEKEVPSFITQVEAASVAAGVEIRSYKPQAAKAQEYYTEVPFEISVDGPFFSVLNFFDRLQKMNRIVSASHLTIGALKGGGAVGGHGYHLAPNETVAATCQLTTYFSNPTAAKPAPAAKSARPRR